MRKTHKHKWYPVSVAVGGFMPLDDKKLEYYPPQGRWLCECGREKYIMIKVWKPRKTNANS